MINTILSLHSAEKNNMHRFFPGNYPTLYSPIIFFMLCSCQLLNGSLLEHEMSAGKYPCKMAVVDDIQLSMSDHVQS